MDLTPELLVEAKFGPARRGYDMREVDDFLERCAEGLDVLLDRLKSEYARAEQAEAQVRDLEATLADTNARLVESERAATLASATSVVAPAPEHDVVASEDESAPAPSPDETVAASDDAGATPSVAATAAPSAPPPPAVDEPMRILIAAERTAEAAIADAKSDAERIRSEAESVASARRNEAESLLARSREEAEAEARRAGEEARRAIETEVLTLRRDPDALANDVRGLRRWLDEQRSRLRTAARDLQRLVDDPAALRDLPVPELQSAEGDDLEEAGAEHAAQDDGELRDDVVSAEEAGASEASDGNPTQAVPAVDPDHEVLEDADRV